ncbi:hypothetical protein ABPG72_007387 [Tetrahymena utriculariae]
MSQDNKYEQYLYDQRDDETVDKQGSIVQQYCDRNRKQLLPAITKQLRYEQENYNGYKSNSLILRMDFSDGSFVQYADNISNNQSFQHSNRCILAIPGVPGSIKDFAPIEKRLEPNFCRFIHLFLPGFDNIDERRGQYVGTLQDGVKMINEFLNNLGIQKVVIMMHSLGGFFGKYFACCNPERVDGLIQIASIPLTEWHGWTFMKSTFENAYNLSENESFSYYNSDEARKKLQQGSSELKASLAQLPKKQQRQFAPALHFSTSDLFCLRKITRSLPGGIGEILFNFRKLDSRIPRLIAYSPKDELATKNLYEEEIYDLLFISNKVNYTIKQQPFKDIQLDLSNFQSNFVFRVDDGSHYLHFEKANELSVLIRCFIETLDYIEVSPPQKQRL